MAPTAVVAAVTAAVAGIILLQYAPAAYGHLEETDPWLVDALWGSDNTITLSYRDAVSDAMPAYIMNEGCADIVLSGGTISGNTATFELNDTQELEGMSRPYVFGPNPALLYREGYATIEIWDPPSHCAHTYQIVNVPQTLHAEVMEGINAWTELNPALQFTQADQNPDFVVRNGTGEHGPQNTILVQTDAAGCKLHQAESGTVRNMVAHQIGHFLGLGHDNVQDSVMWDADGANSTAPLEVPRMQPHDGKVVLFQQVYDRLLFAINHLLPPHHNATDDNTKTVLQNLNHSLDLVLGGLGCAR